MPFGVALLFDAETNRTITQIWETLQRENVTASMPSLGYPPHVSLGVAEQLDRQPFQEELALWVQRLSALPVELPCQGVFPGAGAVFLGVTITSPLAEMHREFCPLWSRFAAGVWEYYAQEHWVPHCTLGHGLDEEGILATMGIALRTALPITGVVDKLSLVEGEPSGEVRELARHTLGPRARGGVGPG